MFPGAVIRKLAFSEEIYARYQAFTSFTAHVRGPVDIDAMSEAFDALLQAHPVFAAHLEEGPDGNHHIVANDLLHSGLVVIDGRRAENPHVQLDQRDSLFRLQLTLGESENLVTAYVHHSLADAHHLGSLLDELLSRYTDVVTTGDPGPITPEPAPQPAEDLLKRRGIKQSALTGFERFLPLLFAYDLPPIAEEMRKFEAPEPVPVTRCRLTSQETADLVSFSRDNGLSFNAVLAAAILLAEWRLRETPHVPIPYCYAVDLRFLLSPPVGATESTNPVGLATYLAEIGPDTDITELAADIVATFRADLSDGMIHQSALRSGRILEGTPPRTATIYLVHERQYAAADPHTGRRGAGGLPQQDPLRDGCPLRLLRLLDCHRPALDRAARQHPGASALVGRHPRHLVLCSLRVRVVHGMTCACALL